jgi:hypothetical protein
MRLSRRCSGSLRSEGKLNPGISSPAGFDFAYAPDAETAEKQVAEEHQISETLRNKLVAVRDEL